VLETWSDLVGWIPIATYCGGIPGKPPPGGMPPAAPGNICDIFSNTVITSLSELYFMIAIGSLLHSAIADRTDGFVMSCASSGSCMILPTYRATQAHQ
jgi:hypothetical protein